MKCPRCGSEMVQEEVDIGVGVLLGPAGCRDCHYMEKQPTDLHDANAPKGELFMRAADVVCEHGVAMDVHCCGCHTGFIFDRDHVCPK